MKKRIKKSNRTNYLGWIVLIVPILYLSYEALDNSFITPYKIKSNPICVNALIYNEFYAGSHYGPTLKYFFTWRDKKYYGSILKELSIKKDVGDTICVVFAATDPSINKPLSYFDNEDIKCNCK